MKQNRNFLLLAASFFALFSSVEVAAQAPASVTIVKAGQLLDPRSGNVLSPAAVLIEDGKVRRVGSPTQVQRDAPTGVKTIDLGNATLLPGLIDSHTHLLLDVVVPPEEESKRHENGNFVPPLLMAIAESPIKRAIADARHDLVAVTGDPVTDITELERVRFVMKNGGVVRNDFAAH